jgi:LysR substrate binding domain.
MAAFRHHYPGIDFTLSVMPPGEATRRVRDGDADLALTFSLAPEKGVKVEHTERAPGAGAAARRSSAGRARESVAR